SPRDVYTGSIGYILPNNDMMFNVAIRTISKYHNEKFAQFGAGGGITIQSNTLDEWNEIKIKTKFITNFYKTKFGIVESMLFKDNNIQNIDKHLNRLKNTADHLLFECNLEQINNRVLQYIKNEKLSDTCKLRLELDYQHNLLIEHCAIAKAKQPIRVGLLKHKIDTSHFMFKYKTTSPLTRGLYTELHNKYTNDEVDEIIFVNQNNEITESRFFNIIIEYQGRLITPPLSCGLLPGIFRQTMIDNDELVEEIITPNMLKSATRLYLCNYVRGLIDCVFIGEIG
ncbi:MAG: chloroperoxidase, partial [Neisseriaceae bacterium]